MPIAMIAETAITQSILAIVRINAAMHKERAFQASSPKTYRLALAPAFFLPIAVRL